MLPSLDRGNPRTTVEFQILLTAHGRSGLREEQPVTCHIVFFFFLVYVIMVLKKLATKVVKISILIFSLCLYAYISSQKVRNCLFFCTVSESVFYTVQYTITVFFRF